MTLALMLAATLATPAPRAVSGDGMTCKVIVHPSRSESKLARARVADMFLRKVKRWSDDSPVEPMDQWMSSAPRRCFTRNVLNMSLLAIEHYWRRQLYSGREAPPRARGSDEDVIAFVRANPQAIGYIAGDTEIGEGVKAVVITD